MNVPKENHVLKLFLNTLYLTLSNQILSMHPGNAPAHYFHIADKEQTYFHIKTTIPALRINLARRVSPIDCSVNVIGERYKLSYSLQIIPFPPNVTICFRWIPPSNV